MSAFNNGVVGVGKKLIAVIALVASVAVVASAAAGVIMSNPLSLLARGAANSAEAIENSAIVKLLGDVADGGSMELALGVEELTEQALGVGIDGNVRFKIYSNKEPRCVANLGVDLGGETFVDVSIFASGEELVLTSDVLLGDDAYGINYENAAQLFEDSLFGPYGEYSIGLDSLEVFTELMEKNEEMGAKQEVLIEELSDVIFASLKEHGEIGKEEDTLLFAGESAKVTAVKIVLDDYAVEEVLGDVLDYLRESEAFVEYLKLYNEYTAIGGKLSAMMLYAEDPYYYESYYGIYSFEEYYEYFYGDNELDIDEVYAALDDAEAELEDMDIEKLALACYISKARTQLIGFELEIETYGETLKCELVAGPTLDDLTELRFSAELGETTAKLVYEVETNDQTEYVAALSMETDGEEVLTAEVEWDKKAGDIGIFLADGYSDLIGLSGEFVVDEQSVVLQIDRVAAAGESLDLDLRVTLDASDKIPAVPESYEDILTLDSGDIETLASGAVMRLMGAFYDLDSDIQMILQGLLW